MDRRRFLRASAGFGATAVAGLAGCLSRDEGDDGVTEGNPDDPDYEGTLTVATYNSMIDTDDSAGPAIKDAFEEEYPDAELEWATPEDRVNHYIQQADRGDSTDADVYFGLNVDDLAQIDDELGGGGLFRELDEDRIERADRIRDGLDMGDPHERVLAYDTGYIAIVYDENEVDEPESFDDLTESAYEDSLLAQDASTSDTGEAFLLWTIDAYGEDGYLEYWRDLEDNGVRILGDWTDAYTAYENEDRPMVVSYSTDQVFTNMEDGDMSRSQIAFPDGQGYANPEGMGIFKQAESVDLAYAFLDFVLSGEMQAELAVKNVQFPAVSEEYVDLPEDFDQYAHEPPEAVTVGYDDLRGNVGDWIDDWGREFATH